MWAVTSAVWISLCVALVLLGLRSGCDRWSQHSTGFNRNQDRQFKALRTGITDSEVFARMGAAPLWTNSEFTLGQYHGNENEYAKTNGVDARVFYTWVNGLDWFYCAGFDPRGRLVVKGEGGT